MNDGTAKASARRRLIRGVFAAPAALTLFSGSVAAGSLSCVAAVVNHPPVTPINADGTSTSILRVPLRVLRDVDDVSVLAKFVSAVDIGLLFPESLTESSYLMTDDWECVFSTDSSRFEAGVIYTSSQIEATIPGNSPEMEGSSEYVAVRVSADGAVLGVQGFYDDLTGTKTSPMFVSCWCSFGGEAPFNGM